MTSEFPPQATCVHTHAHINSTSSRAPPLSLLPPPPLPLLFISSNSPDIFEMDAPKPATTTSAQPQAVEMSEPLSLILPTTAVVKYEALTAIGIC